MASQEEDCKNQMPTAGELCWLEIPCTDVARVVAFYRIVLGWESADPASTPLMPTAIEGADGVHIFRSGKMHQGCFVKMSKPEGVAAVADSDNLAKSAVLASYYVVSIEETLKKVEEAGGRVHVPKTPIAGGSMGYLARFIDSEGNLQGLWSAPKKPE
ncbi:hypothetical protein VTI74DRAFT_4377 [Chaetomium olivicolor]